VTARVTSAAFGLLASLIFFVQMADITKAADNPPDALSPTGTAISAGDQNRPSQNPAASTPRSVSLADAHNIGYDSSDIPWRQIFQLSCAVALGLVAFGFQLIMFWGVSTSGDDIIKASVLTLVITFAVCSLIFGFDDKKTAPIVGLFGTIIGFLLGRSDKKTEPEPSPRQPTGSSSVNPQPGTPG